MEKILIPEKREEKEKKELERETLQDLNDKELILNVREGRKEYKKGLTKPYRFKKK